MASPEQAPVLFFDFDNTITLGDVLDDVIDRYSATTAWREWESAWREGRITTLECLQRQIGDLRVPAAELIHYVSAVPIDPAFPEIATWAGRRQIDLTIVSDNFLPLIQEILRRNRLEFIPVFANELVFHGEKLEARFPLRDQSCARCAHCKGQHLRAIAKRPRIYVGDGLSDTCPALVADIVFAKDSLADEMTRRGLPFRPFASLAVVRDFLQSTFGY